MLSKIREKTAKLKEYCDEGLASVENERVSLLEGVKDLDNLFCLKIQSSSQIKANRVN
jgi:hypothetical protein